MLCTGTAVLAGGSLSPAGVAKCRIQTKCLMYVSDANKQYTLLRLASSCCRRLLLACLTSRIGKLEMDSGTVGSGPEGSGSGSGGAYGMARQRSQYALKVV